MTKRCLTRIALICVSVTLGAAAGGCRPAGVTKPAEAEKQAEKTVRPRRDEAEAHLRLGASLLLAGEAEEAVEHFRKALQIDPDSAAAHYNLGNALVVLGELDEGVAHYTRAIDIQPRHPGAHAALGRALLTRGKIAAGIAHVRTAVALRPNNPEYRVLLGNALARQGKFEQAAGHLRTAVAANPSNLKAINSLAWHLATCPADGVRNGAEAVKLAELACEGTSYQRPGLMDTLAAAYAETGRFAEAVATAWKAIELAEASRQEQITKEIRRRLELYTAGKPYRARGN